MASIHDSIDVVAPHRKLIEDVRLAHRRSHRSLSPVAKRAVVLADADTDIDSDTESDNDSDPDTAIRRKARKETRKGLCGHLDSEYRERMYLHDASVELVATNEIKTCRPEILADGRLIISCPGVDEIPNANELVWLKQTLYERGVLTITLFPWERPMWFRFLYSYVSIQLWASLLCLLIAVAYYMGFGLPVEISDELYQYAYLVNCCVSFALTLFVT